MKTDSELVRIGRRMSGLLRHTPEKANLKLDSQGYVKVKSLCEALKINPKELNWIVDNNNKKRFAYKNDAKKLIRASQGHSIDIDHGYESIVPPVILFHGTSRKFNDSIFKTGLCKMNRQHVHLTDDYDTAINVGKRKLKMDEYGLWIISIDAEKMYEDNYVFYISENGVYLTDNVPTKYFTPIIQ